MFLSYPLTADHTDERGWGELSRLKFTLPTCCVLALQDQGGHVIKGYMKKVFMAGLLVILALWFGYSFGYQQGLHEEGKAWRATATADRDPASRAIRISYRDPRARIMVLHSSGMNAINVPDPRVYRQYEQSSP